MLRHRDTLLFQLQLPFLAFLLIPMLLLNGAIIRLLDGIRQGEYQEHLSRMETAGNWLNYILEESTYIARKLSLDNSLQQLTFMSRDKGISDYAELYATEKTFRQHILSNSDNYSLHIYYPGNSVLLSTDAGCSDLSYFYGKSYRFGDYSLEEFNAMAEAAGYEPEFHAGESFLIDNTSYEGFFYTAALNKPKAPGQSKALILVVIRQEFLNEALSALNENGGFSYVTDRSGRLLAVSGEPACPIADWIPDDMKGRMPEDIYGKRYAAAYICLPGGVNLFSVTPADTVVENTRFLTRLALILNMAALLVCMTAVISITKRKEKKLRHTFSMLNLPKGEKWENYHDNINRGIAMLVDTNRSLSDRLSRNIFLLRNDFWNRLLYNGFTDEAELRESAAHADLNLNAAAFCLLLFSVRKNDSAPESDVPEEEAVRAYRELLLDDMERKASPRGYVYHMPVQQTLVFLRFTEKEAPEYRRIAERMTENLPAPPSGISVHCAGSRLFDSVMNARDEYAWCGNILLYQYNTPHPEKEFPIWSGEEYTESPSLDFPQKLSDRILAAIRAGENDTVDEALREVLSRNFNNETPVTPLMSSLLLTKIKILITETYREEMGFSLYGRLTRIDSLPSDALKLSRYIALIGVICNYYRENVSRKTERLREKIAGYVNENFNSPSFSLTETAAFCGFSDSYFSMLFREIMQVNFSSYVEKLKMEHADRLLKETDLKIDDIARQTGYSDANTFRRAYKKYYSVSPGQRRKAT